MAHYAEGAAYTVGPTNNISIRLSSMVREMGGEVFCDATVEEIIIENGRAVGVKVRNTSAGEHGQLTQIRARNIVCATSVFNLHNKVSLRSSYTLRFILSVAHEHFLVNFLSLHQFLPSDHPSVKEFFDPEKRTITPSNGHVFLFVKIKGDATELQLPRHNLWYFNSYDMDEGRVLLCISLLVSYQ